MSSTGNCYDNAPMENFWHTLKVERVHGAGYETREEAKRDVFAYIEGFYNCDRRHSARAFCRRANSNAVFGCMGLRPPAKTDE